MSDKEFTVEELMAKLEASSRINTELIEREKNALDKLSVYEKAEAELKEKEAEAKAKAEFELRVQEEVAKQLAAKDALGGGINYSEEPDAEEPVEDKTEEPVGLSDKAKKLANRLKI